MKPLATACLIYLGVVAALYIFQRSLQYFPDPSLVTPEEAGLANFETVRFTAEDGIDLIAWYARARDGKPTIVYFQGNAQGIAARAERFELFQQHGYGVFALGYRGYSGSRGEPTEEGLLHDGRAAVSYLAANGVPQQNQVLYGESLGSGIAVQLAANAGTRPLASILEAPFTSAADVARTRYWYVPVSLLMKDQFRSLEHIRRITAPLFIMHGDADRVVPFAHGKTLFEAATSPKEFLAIEGGGHIDDLTMEIWRRMEQFIHRHRAS